MSSTGQDQMTIPAVGWPPIIWVICRELVSDKAIDIILNFLPGFNKKDEIRDAIKAIANGDWMSFTWEAAKIAVGQIPWVKVLDAANELRQLYKVVEKIYDWIGQVGTAALERAWGILGKSPAKFSVDALKYVEEVKFPKFGWATSNDWRQNFKNYFPNIPEVEFDNLQVHHAVPRKVEYHYGLVSPNQVHSVENLRGIPNSTRAHAIITARWSTWYNNHPNFTLEDALNYAKEIDDEFGHLFVPPIR